MHIPRFVAESPKIFGIEIGDAEETIIADPELVLIAPLFHARIPAIEPA
jgi:hypothetical protein